ncbi:MAG TPA: radical SAM protein [Thermotogota bacterium]|nr:radical SAM protein [Thermotogota bacterium]NLH18874.1 radical SAM protein [Thermotogaceae bacterium]OQC28861.1 MAG: Antilisterial bacteriocin subtilosin biosynthesis protein AlbA [Thermotogota bacterium ADurb.Bin062]HOD91720.1 radical SAM protein [Thermotogota bacterium]HOF22572.1 radical SAM protein [Thermotogota bacterium]
MIKNETESRNQQSRIKRLISAFDLVNPRMGKVFFPWLLKHPKYFRQAFTLLKAFEKAEEKRAQQLARGLLIPPVVILSITSGCNLSCEGCFACATGTVSQPQEAGGNAGPGPSLDYTQWKRIIAEASQAGVFCFLIAGGEPFLFPETFQLVRDFPHLLFVVFTNGTMMSDSILQDLKKAHNLLVAVSLEGDETLTDLRRGKGTYRKAMDTLRILEKNGVLNGISVTINRLNYGFWAKEEHIDRMIESGVRIAFLTEMIPVSGGEEDYPDTSYGMAYATMLTDEERSTFRQRVLYYREHKNLFIIHSPGDEEAFGGCVSAGKGFIHITPYGDVTPCPVSNIATDNLKTCSFENAMRSELFKRIREEEHLLETGNGPCALFSHQKEVEALRKEVGAYRTGT